MWWVVVGFMLFLVYGLLNLLFPRMTIGWQNRSTARGSVGRGVVGGAVQQILGQTTTDGRNEPAVRRRVRLVGLAEIVIAAGVIAVALART